MAAHENECQICNQYLRDRFGKTPNIDTWVTLALNKELDGMSDIQIQDRIEMIDAGIKICKRCIFDQKVIDEFRIYELQDNYLRNALEKFQRDKILAPFPSVPTEPPTNGNKKRQTTSPTRANRNKSPKRNSCEECEAQIDIKSLNSYSMKELKDLKSQIEKKLIKCKACKNLCKDTTLCKKYSALIKLYTNHLFQLQLHLNKF